MDNLNGQFSFRELYDVVLKATQPFNIGSREIEVGETIATFSKINLGVFDEQKKFISANGGFDNRAWVWWEESKEAYITLSAGVFSKTQFSLLTNAKILEKHKNSLNLNCQEHVESDENGVINFKYPVLTPFFLYELNSGEKITDYQVISNQSVKIEKPYCEVIADYWRAYENGYSVVMIGQSLINQSFSLIGKTKIKNDVTGQVTTGIITIPKLKITSDLSMRLGDDAIPLVGKFEGRAIPVGERNQKKIMEIILLSDDIDSDM